jgi:hypothetical protein
MTPPALTLGRPGQLKTRIHGADQSCSTSTAPTPARRMCARNSRAAAGPGYGNWGEFIYSGSGRCLAENADLDRVVMQNCGTDLSWQEWEPLPVYPGTVYVNGYTGLLLATNTLISGRCVYADGTTNDQYATWYS